MKRGFGWLAWLEARKRVLPPAPSSPSRTHGRADELAARTALCPRTGNVAPYPVHPPTKREG